MKASPLKLTKRSVEAAESKALRYDLWDCELRGFGLRVETSGRKTFFIRYRANGGGRTAPRRFMTVGQYPTLTVDEARRKAKALLGDATNGNDPAAERTCKRKEMTVAQLIEAYATEGTAHLKPTTRQYTLARLRNHVLPLLGRKKVTEVEVSDVERMMRSIRDGKTKRDEKTAPRTRIIVKGGAGAAAKVVRDLSALYKFAQHHKIVAANPCEHAHKPSDNKREAFLTHEDMQKFGTALNQVAQEGANAMAVAIIRLLALTGCRRNEICGLRWAEIDVEHACLRLTETKTGKSVRPLGEAALRILETLPRDTESEFVFPATRGDSHYQGLKRVWKRVRKLSGLPHITPHTLRHTLASEAVSYGETLPMVGALLGHANAQSTQRYAHIANDPAHKAINRVTDRIENAMQIKSGSNVVYIHGS